MPIKHFEPWQLYPLICAAVLFILSVVFFQKRQYAGVVLLFFGALAMGCFIAHLDPFLALWDEQYHALVAKNLSNNFLKPTLYANPVLDYHYENWTRNHVWLHKQPLFLWQMALSIKIFGPTTFAVRLPSIIMHAFITVFIFLIGKLVRNAETGFYGALIFAASFYPLQLIVGGHPSDHNDVAFLFYSTAAFWAWFEYQHSKSKTMLVCIGIFSGCAVLVKWLMGLLVFIMWLVTKTIDKPKEVLQVKTYLPFIYSAIISVVIFLPWQIFTFVKYPLEAKHEWELNGRHFFEVIEEHSEPFFYYFTDGFKMMYGSGFLVPILVWGGLVYFIIKIPIKKYKIMVTASVIFVYAFFTLATTKMNSFPIIVSPFIILGFGHLIFVVNHSIEQRIKFRPIALVLVVLIPLFVAYTSLNLRKIQGYHTFWKPWDNRNRDVKIKERAFINTLPQKLKGNYVVFNTNLTFHGFIPVMFYTDFVAYDHIPSADEIESVKEKGYAVAIVDLGDLPEYILNNDAIVKLRP